MNLLHYLNPDCIVCDPVVKDKKALLKLLVETLRQAGVTDQPGPLMDAILAREDLASTGLGLGCAIPHALCPAASRTAIVLARLSRGIDFQATDRLPVRLVILMVGPADGSALHLKLLSRLARLLHDPLVRQALLQAPDATSLFQIVSERDTQS